MSTRRELLATAVLGTSTLLAGCVIGSDDDNQQVQPGEARDDLEEIERGPEPDPDVPERIHEHVITARGYDGSIEDRTGEEEIEVFVGFGEDGLAFEPPVIRIETGTTLRFLWTGVGGAHNVVARPESDAQFSSGEEVDTADKEFEHTFEDAGIGTYWCTPHRATGMRGGIEIVLSD